jgi:SpoVK/Ycf46/Vps4 family AAA+-type ATPase
MLFLGNPGTGKTSVAKLIGTMFHEMGLLSKGHTVEANRSMLIGEYIGQTEIRTNEAIEKARGGVLFIDEAYALAIEECDIAADEQLMAADAAKSNKGQRNRIGFIESGSVIMSGR